jgi:uncharacterized membrane protein YvbJ
MRCVSCGSENPEGARFCIECGSAVTRSCQSCGLHNLPQAKFCAECGTPLEGTEPRPAAKRRKDQDTIRARKTPRWVASPPVTPPRPTPAEAERRQLTVAFIDLVG